MEYVYQHLQEIVRELHRNSQASLPSTPPPSSLAAGQSLWSAPELEFMVALLGQEHMLSAMQLVDRGVVCLTSGTRSLFRIGRQGHSGEQDLCFCILPGRFCTSCSAGNSHAADGKSFQKQDALPCVHITAVLLAAAQSRCVYEELSAQEMATALFTIT